MSDHLKHPVYSLYVLEFVTVAKEYCIFLENAARYEKSDFMEKTLKLTTLLYMKALMIPKIELINEGEIEKFVTELDYNLIKEGIYSKMGRHDSYLDFFDFMLQETPEPVTCSISENLADVYQDLKNFMSVYKMGITELMNDALYECKNNFELYWGQRAIASVKILHHHIFVEKDTNEEQKGEEPKRNTEDWFISKRQQDFRK